MYIEIHPIRLFWKREVAYHILSLMMHVCIRHSYFPNRFTKQFKIHKKSFGTVHNKHQHLTMFNLSLLQKELQQVLARRCLSQVYILDQILHNQHLDNQQKDCKDDFNITMHGRSQESLSPQFRMTMPARVDNTGPSKHKIL